MDPAFKLIVDGREVAAGTLRRAVAPAAVSELERAGRLSGNAIIKGNAVGMVTRLKVGASKARAEFRAGEVAVNPADGSLWIFFGDAKPQSPMVPLGNVTQGLEEVAKIRRGARVIFVVVPAS